MTRSTLRRVAVVGAGGFLGRWLIGELQRLEWEVEEFDRLRLPVVDGRINPMVLNSDVVFWLATRTNPALAAANPELVELELTEFDEFLARVSDGGGSSKVVIVSSGGTVYDSRFPPPYMETSPLRAVHPYASLKLRMERLIAESGLSHCIVRMSNPYGPGQPAGRGQGVVAEWVRSIAQKRPIPIIGSLETRRDFLFIGDAARGLATIAAVNVDGIVNLGSGTGTTLQRVLDHLVFLSPYPVSTDQLPSRHFDVSSTWLSIDRMLVETDWRPMVSLESGLERTLRAQLAEVGRV
jgi:UDP-glucose 4-epimerase